jgi:hypothetical protein
MRLDQDRGVRLADEHARGGQGLQRCIGWRVPDAGSQYLIGSLDDHGEPFDGSRTYKVTMPPDIPARAFRSLTLYDNQTRSMLQTPQKYPRAGSQSYPSPAAEADAGGSTTVWFAPEQPEGVARGTGSRPTRRRAGSRSCACTARCRRSSTSPGARAR